MRHRWIMSLVLSTVVLVLGVGVAFADNGPHGGFNTTTDACAGCHRAHTAIGDNLLKSATSYDLCVSCHGATGTGAYTNVVDGLWKGTSGGSLKGGGFTNVTMNSALGTGASAGTATSKHEVVGMSGYTNGTVWGIGGLGSGAGSTFALQCSNCHDPHGKASTTGAATYRILRGAPTIGGIGTAVNVSDVSDWTYTIMDSTTGKYYGQKYPGASDTATDNDKIATLSGWCATCHTRIHATGPGSSGDAIYNYRHTTTGSNVSNSSTNGAPACLTCHVAHGTKAQHSGYADTVPKPGTAEGGGSYMGSSLLRVDNRGVCQACHNK